MATMRQEAVRRADSPPITRTESQVLLGAAGLAPSVMNTQPWVFEISGSAIEVSEDENRVLRSSIDPLGRQMVISCGAAIFNLRVAAAYLGREVDVRLNPGPSGPLATVMLGQRGKANPYDAALFPAVRRRHTHRRPFVPRAVPGSVLFELAQCVHVENAAVVPVNRAQRGWLFDLIALAEGILGQTPAYEADLYKWTTRAPSRGDGIPMRAFGTLSSTGAPPMRDFGAARGIAPQVERYAPDPWTAILVTASDDRVAWLHAGQALQRLLLTASSRGLGVSFLNQPLDYPEIRRDLVTSAGYPQMILRMGYSAAETATPRRAVDDLMRRPRSRR